MRHGLWFVAVLWLCASLVFGQAQTTGTVTGTALDEAGKPIPGATIKIAGAALQGERTATADAQGRFRLPLLPPGDYLLTVNAPDKQEGVVGFTLGLGRTVDIPVQLLAESKVEIEVLGSVSRLNTTANGENFNYGKLVDDLPIQNRTLEAVAFNAPNMAAGPNNGQLSISGANAFDTVVLLEGAEISDPFFGDSPEVYIEDAIDEVQVLTSGISARYGRFVGGVLNAVTKSGGNAYSGSFRTELTNEKWNSQTPFGEDQQDKIGKVFSGTVGGYVLKDRLWFFAAARKFDNSVTTTTTTDNGSASTDTSEQRLQGKLRAAINADQIVEGSYLDFDSDVGPLAPLPAGELAALAPNRKDPRKLYALTYQGILSDKLFLDAKLTKKKVSIVSGGVDTQHSPLIDLNSFLVYNSAWFDGTQTDVRDNQTASGNLSYTWETPHLGTHLIEGGLQYVQSKTAGDNRQSASGFNLLNGASDLVNGGGSEPLSFNLGSFSDGSFNLRWEAVPLGGAQKLDYTAAYVQDAWSLGRWRVDAGLRYEQYKGNGPITSGLIDFHKMVPRLGVTYDLTDDWQVQATWGRYLGRFNDNYAQNVSGVGGAPRFVSLYNGPSLTNLSRDEMEAALRNDTGWITVDFAGPQFATTVFAPGVESAFSQELNLAVKHALPKGQGEVAVTVTDRSFHHLIDDFIGGGKVIEVPNPDGGDPFVFDQRTWRNSTEAKRRYDAVALTWNWRPNAFWNWGGNYTYAQLRGNYTGESANQPASGSQIGDYPASIFPNTAVSYGPLPGDIPHRIRTWLTYRLDLQRAGALTFGALGRFASGQPWSRVATVAYPFDDPNSVADSGSYNYFFEPRGSNRFSSSWALDTSVRYAFPIYKTLKAWAKLDVSNLLDNDALLSFDTSGTAETTDDGRLFFQPSATFGRAQGARDYQLPRTYLVSLGLQF